MFLYQNIRYMERIQITVTERIQITVTKDRILKLPTDKHFHFCLTRAYLGLGSFILEVTKIVET